jgi:uncharacterized secreted protein with C-terminal beta-propeller domain
MMKHYFSGFLITLLLLAVFSQSQANQQTSGNGFTAADNAIRTGLWWNPTRAGHGLDIQFSGKTLFVIWYTYDKSGAPIWYLGTGEQRDSQWTIPLQRYQWNHAKKKATPTNVGSMTLTFSNASAASMSWQIAERQKEENIEPYLLSGTQATDDHTGTWFDVTEPGYGLTMSNQGNYDIAVLYFYDDNGNPVWALGDNGGEKSTSLQLFSYKSTCPDCENLQTQGSPVGNINYSFNSENEATFNAAIEQSGQLSFTWLKTNKTLSLLSNPASGRPHPAALAQFISDDALEQFIKEGMKARGQPSVLSSVDFSPAPTQPIPGDGTFSTTNIQVAGVDEADIVKTDGQYMYLADPTKQNIRIIEMQEQPAKITEKALIELDQTNPLNGMYLLTDRSAGDDLLVTIHGGAISAVWELSFIWDTPWPWVGGKTNIKFYNVSQPGQPKKLTSLTLDGVLITSRRIGETLYVVTRFSPDESQPIASDSPEGIPSTQQRETSIDNLTLDELLPTFSIDSSEAGTSEQLITANSTFLPPIPDGYRGTDIITVSKIDLKNPDAAPQSVSIVGQSEAVYVSQQALYLSTSKYNYLVTPFESSGSDDTTQVTPSIPISQRTTTQIHKISLTENAPVYSGSATIEGYLDGTADQKPFRFSEHEGVLRVVSSGDWKSLGQHRVTLLRESSNSLMEEISHLPNKTNPAPLGKPGENLYATRFLGTRLFMVTFLQTDPLIVVDLANPSDPKLKGELEIPGYSDYLHPIGENLLLGIGKDAIPATDGFIGDDRGAWYQGIRIGLFDISGQGGPQQLDNVIIGQRGSETELFSDHHAFSFLPASQETNRPTRFSVPIDVHGREFPTQVSSDPQTYYDWSHSGLYLFEVNAQDSQPQLKTVGSIVTQKASVNNQFEYPQPGSNRAVLTGDSVFYGQNADIWSADWAIPKQAIGPQ